MGPPDEENYRVGCRTGGVGGRGTAGDAGQRHGQVVDHAQHVAGMFRRTAFQEVTADGLVRFRRVVPAAQDARQIDRPVGPRVEPVPVRVTQRDPLLRHEPAQVIENDRATADDRLARRARAGPRHDHRRRLHEQVHHVGMRQPHHRHRGVGLAPGPHARERVGVASAQGDDLQILARLVDADRLQERQVVVHPCSPVDSSTVNRSGSSPRPTSSEARSSALR